MKTPSTASAARIKTATNTPANSAPVCEWFRFICFPFFSLRREPAKSSQKPPKASPEPHFYVRLVLQVNGVHKAHARRRECHDDGLRPCAVAKKAYAFQ